MSRQTSSLQKLSRRFTSATFLGILLGAGYGTLLVSPTVSHGQEYLELPANGNDSTIVDRFMSLRDKFRRDSQQSRQSSAQSSQGVNPRSPRYRNTSRSISQNQRSQRSGAPPASNLPSGISSRSRSQDLLPDTELFSRGSQPLPKAPQYREKRFDTEPLTAERLTPSTSAPRAGSKSSTSEPASPQVARKSPSASRANELDAALADLLNTNPAATEKPVASKPKFTQRSAAVAPGTFDLRQALRDDKNDSLAREVAKAVEAPAKPKFADPVEETPALQDSAIEVPAKKSIEPKNIDPLSLQPKPKQEVAPDSEPTVVPEAIVLEPIAEQDAAQPAITIAQPPAEFQLNVESKPAVRPSPRIVVDSSEAAAKQEFDAPQQGNPMRPFLPATEPAEPESVIARPEPGMLQTTQQAVIVSHVEGPRSILVGHEATYQVTLENTSSTPAENLLAEISVPEWAELVDAMSTSGVVERSSNGADPGALEWKLSELPPRSSQALRLRLIPRSGRPLQLGVRWSMEPMEAQTIVEVQEPKLEVAISGPQEVHFGKPQRYRLTLTNPGTGTTEQVSLRLVPPGGDPQSASTQQIGNLKPGEVKDIDLELTAREAGELLIQANAFAEGGLTAETTKTVLCLKPELSVDWRGPDKKYAGTVAAYYFRVENPGTAATEPVEMSVKLPAGTEFVGASEGYSINAATGVVSWRLASIAVGEEQFMQLRCKIAKPGKNEFEVIAKTTDGDLTDNKDFFTEVIALADLQLDVRDPQGPLPLGEAVVYEIRVRNRGTTGAENVNVVGLFSEGIDPTTVEGAQYTVRDGRVSFHPIKSLPAGREIQLRIHAKASQVGTHIFRTEVTCPKLDIKLAAEETTRFYEEEHRWQEGQTPYMAERESPEPLEQR